MVEQVFAPHGTGLFATRTTLTDAPGARTRQTHRATLFLWGDEDPLGSPDAARLLVEKMPHARLDVVADASHLVWLDQPDVCAEAVVAFLTSTETAAGAAHRS